MLRVVEIEKETSSDFAEEENVSDWAARAAADQRPTCGAMQGRRVSFQNTINKPMATLGTGAVAGPGGIVGRNRSPPAPSRVDVSSSEDEDDDDDDDERDDRDEEDSEDDDDDDIAEDIEGSDDELSLRRFGSGAAKPPKLVEDDSDSDEDDRDEPVSPDGMPSDAELQNICKGPESKELAELYQGVKRCPCHGHDAPGVERVWEWPKKVGDRRIAVVQFADGGDLKEF